MYYQKPEIQKQSKISTKKNLKKKQSVTKKIKILMVKITDFSFGDLEFINLNHLSQVKPLTNI